MLHASVRAHSLVILVHHCGLMPALEICTFKAPPDSSASGSVVLSSCQYSLGSAAALQLETSLKRAKLLPAEHEVIQSAPAAPPPAAHTQPVPAPAQAPPLTAEALLQRVAGDTPVASSAPAASTPRHTQEATGAPGARRKRRAIEFDSGELPQPDMRRSSSTTEPAAQRAVPRIETIDFAETSTPHRERADHSARASPQRPQHRHQAAEQDAGTAGSKSNQGGHGGRRGEDSPGMLLMQKRVHDEMADLRDTGAHDAGKPKNKNNHKDNGNPFQGGLCAAASCCVGLCRMCSSCPLALTVTRSCSFVALLLLTLLPAPCCLACLHMASRPGRNKGDDSVAHHQRPCLPGVSALRMPRPQPGTRANARRAVPLNVVPRAAAQRRAAAAAAGPTQRGCSGRTSGGRKSLQRWRCTTSSRRPRSCTFFATASTPAAPSWPRRRTRAWTSCGRWRAASTASATGRRFAPPSS